MVSFHVVVRIKITPSQFRTISVASNSTWFPVFLSKKTREMRETRNSSTTISILYNVTQPNETTHCYQDESSSGCKDLPDIVLGSITVNDVGNPKCKGKHLQDFWLTPRRSEGWVRYLAIMLTHAQSKRSQVCSAQKILPPTSSYWAALHVNLLLEKWATKSPARLSLSLYQWGMVIEKE
jgi:hypothetical protein